MTQPNAMKYKKQLGISLLEIVIALAILGVLTTQLVKVSAVSREYDQHKEDITEVTHAKKLLLSFLQTNGYLPCPDTDSDGWENRSGNQCTSDSGKLPHLMLGISLSDNSGQTLYYKVNSETVTANIDNNLFSASYFGIATSPPFALSTPPTGTTAGSGNLTVCSETETTGCNASSPSSDLLEEAAIAVVVNFGKNSDQTWSYINSGNLTALSLVEKENADDDNYFWQSPANQADDSIVWITGYEAKYSLLKSEQGIN